MRKILFLMVGLSSLSTIAWAQHGTAKSGYYPNTYNGDAWTGTLTTVSDDRREMTLSYTDEKHRKTETFVGVLENGHITQTKDGQKYDLKPSMIPVGARLTVYYTVATKKEGEKKIKVNMIFLIKGIPNLKAVQTYFKAF